MLENEIANLKEPKINKNIAPLKKVLSDDFFEKYEKASINQKNELWRSIIESIEVSVDGNITINFLP